MYEGAVAGCLGPGKGVGNTAYLSIDLTYANPRLSLSLQYEALSVFQLNTSRTVITFVNESFEREDDEGEEDEYDDYEDNMDVDRQNEMVGRKSKSQKADAGGRGKGKGKPLRELQA